MFWSKPKPTAEQYTLPRPFAETALHCRLPAVGIKFEIPEITDEELQRLVERIRPMVIKDGIPYLINEPNLRNIAFTWSPDLAEQAPVSYRPYEQIYTLHEWGYYGCFKPSIAEVLAQIPEDCLDDDSIVAFTTEGPHDATDLNNARICTDAGYHCAVTTLWWQRRPY